MIASGPTTRSVHPAEAEDEESFTTISRWPLSFRVFNAAERVLYVSGAAAAYSRVFTAPGAAILTYHSVLAPGEESWIDPSNSIEADQFERHVRFLHAHRRVVPMSRLIDDLESGRPIQRRTVVVTFDDGYLDVLSMAAPILARFGLPAIVYLSTRWNENGESSWIDRLFTAFRHSRFRHISLPSSPLGSGPIFNGETLAAYRTLNEYLIPMESSQRQEVLAEIERQLRPAAKAPRLIMNWDEVRALVRQYPTIELGVHTVDHSDLTRIPDEEIRRQVGGAADAIEREVGIRPVHFSFPYDRADARTRAVVASCGMRSAIGSDRDGLVRDGADRFALPRVSTMRSLNRLRFTTCGAYPELEWKLLGRA